MPDGSAPLATVTESPLDLFGAAASLVCALHCLALPLLLAFAPVLGERLHSHAFDLGFAAFALGFGGFVLGRAWIRHRDPTPLRWFGLASLLLIAGVTVLHDVPGHTLVLGAGGLALALAHLRNRRLACGPGALRHRH